MNTLLILGLLTYSLLLPLPRVTLLLPIFLTSLAFTDGVSKYKYRVLTFQDSTLVVKSSLSLTVIHLY